MKNNSPRKDSQKISLMKDQKITRSAQNLAFSTKVSNPTMTPQIALPSARVWENIERILDQQDNERNSVNTLISRSFETRESTLTRRGLYLALVAAISIIGSIMWILR
jgi:hypothetical protein